MCVYVGGVVDVKCGLFLESRCIWVDRTSWSGVGSWPSNRTTEGTRLYFVILLQNVEKIFDWH